MTATSGTQATAGLPGVADLLDAAVGALGGTRRDGQVAMARAVARAIDTGQHLAVQAGTGTGKSLAYLVPAIRHAVERDTTVVVSTATLALQRQLVERDLPRLAAALSEPLGRRPQFAILKGRRNYLCLHRLHSGPPEEPDDGLFDPFTASATGRDVKRLHEWADDTTTGDRDEVVPGVSERAWRQVSVSARECLGAARCPQASDCFAEHARAAAGRADVVVTNHALLAIDALQDHQVLPEHELVIVDEAHDLVDRVTSANTDELTGNAVSTAAKRGGRVTDAATADRLLEAADGLTMVLDDLPDGRLDTLPQALRGALPAVRDAAHACLTALGSDRREDPADATARTLARTALDDVHDTAVRILDAFDPDPASRHDVVWCTAADDHRPATLRVAPLSVAGLLRQQVFGTRTTVLTSATLALGGSFDALARQWGLPREAADDGTDSTTGSTTPSDDATGPGTPVAADAAAPVTAAGSADVRSAAAAPSAGTASSTSGDDTRSGARLATAKPAPGSTPQDIAGADDDVVAAALRWRGLDVGSPFDHASNGILYLAAHLPPPGRDGLGEQLLTELTDLVNAAGGRTLGLFSSMRAARQAAEQLRDDTDLPILCQGDDATGLLVSQFADDPRSCLFGTLSLWQGVDVPGPSLQLVVIDRIPFPRPDDPVRSARQRVVESAGGNGFMAVAATHAALLLAQGAGRLHRTSADRGVVAVLDSRLATARYGAFLRASLPPWWQTRDGDVARAALRRLDAAHPQ